MTIVFSPSDVSNLTLQAVEELKSQAGKGVRTGIDSLDLEFLPMRSGELVVVMGYTSNYKSGFMNYIIKSSLKQREDNEIVIKVTWEDSVEEDTLKWISSDSGISVGTIVLGQNYDWEQVMQSYRNRIDTPLWIIGHSNVESVKERKARPRLTMNDVAKAIEYIREEATDHKYKVKLIALDYLQRIRPDAADGNTKREQMMEAVNKAKDMAISFGCPVLLGVQSKRDVLDRDFKLPRIDDGQETSNIEQSADKVISLWYPIKTEKPDTKIDVVNKTVSKNLLICGVLKQKMGFAPITLPLYVEPDKNIVRGMP